MEVVKVIAELISLPVLVSSLLGFLILVWVLKKFLWKPVLQVIDERRESIETAYREVDEARKDVARMKEEYEQRLGEINDEAQQKLQEAIEKGQQVAGEIRQAAEESREKLVQKTQADIAREKDKAIAELRNTAIDLSFSIAERVMKEQLDREGHEKLAHSFVEELKGMD
ncbi:F0F1 ATP synthase subunit B [bacterium]|nr:F0F1 ATP synthase subunit B [bacterium]